MIVDADDATDRDVFASSANLYANYKLRRVCYSAFSSIPDASAALPLLRPPLMREHRLYQADWLLRFHGFGVDEIAPPGESPMLSLDIDPKLAWALRHRDLFPVDINRAAKESLLRIPGLGVRNVKRILQLRKLQSLRLEDLTRLRAPLRKMLPFIVTADHTPGLRDEDTSSLRAHLAPRPKQIGLFDA